MGVAIRDHMEIILLDYRNETILLCCAYWSVDGLDGGGLLSSSLSYRDDGGNAHCFARGGTFYAVA
jgi:hypothetical protein